MLSKSFGSLVQRRTYRGDTYYIYPSRTDTSIGKWKSIISHTCPVNLLCKLALCKLANNIAPKTC